MSSRFGTTLLLCALVLVSSGSSYEHVDVIFNVDLTTSELSVIASGVRGPRFRVATGSPHHPTPTGEFTVERWIANPTFTPGPVARSRGAKPAPASEHGPLGFAKMPFFESFQVHGGAHRYAVGMPATLGCVELTNDSMRALDAWLAEAGAFDDGVLTAQGERVHAFIRPAVIRIR